MTIENKNLMKYYPIIIPLMVTGFLVTGCAQIGDRSVSLIPRTKLTDPLEVPPGLSPLPEPEQFVVPGELAASESGPPDLGPEQLRAYQIWLEFEEFKKYQEQVSGAGLTPEGYQMAKMSGEGLFKISTITDLEVPTIRLLVYDDVDTVWNMLPSVLADMNVYISRVIDEERTMFVGNTGAKEQFRLAQRFRLKEYSGSIDQLRVRSVDGEQTEIVGLTDTDVLVNPEAGREFFGRLRFYLLTRYENEDGRTYTQSGQNEVRKWMLTGADGQQSILVADRFESVWAKVGRTLQGAGAGIQDMNRSEGVYYVSFGGSSKQKKKRKFRWQFWRPKSVELPTQNEYQVFVKQQGDNTEVSVKYAGEGADRTDNMETERNVLLIIYERLTV